MCRAELTSAWPEQAPCHASCGETAGETVGQLRSRRSRDANRLTACCEASTKCCEVAPNSADFTAKRGIPSNVPKRSERCTTRRSGAA
jgi:hypothetical protein